MGFLENLNTSQLRAVQQEPSELLIFAGPGSGKTRVLTSRIAAFVLERNFLPSRLRAVTFTRAATAEMRERLNGYGIRGVTITTLHGLAREVINKFYRSHPHLVRMCSWAKREAPLCWIDGMDVTQLPLLDPKKDAPFRLTPEIGLHLAFGHVVLCVFREETPNVRLLSLQQSLQATQALESASGLPDFLLTRFWERVTAYISLSRLKTYVTQAIGMSIRASLEPEDLAEIQKVLGTFLEEYAIKYTDFLDSVAVVYNHLLETNGLIDYTAQLTWAHRILRNDPETLATAQGLYDAYFIDEFQDTDPVQFETLRLLSGGHHNLTAVGDPNQAIYGFRGADVSGILRFKGVFPNARSVALDTNYRSTHQIVDASYAVVTDFQENGWTRCQGLRAGVPVRCLNNLNEIQSLPQDLCILARTNQRVKAIGEKLHKEGIPYKLITRWQPQMDFCVPKHRVTPVLDVLRAAEALEDDERLFAAIQHLKGVGPKTVAALADPEVLRKNYKVKAFIKWISKRKPSVPEIRESPLLKLSLNYLPPDVTDAETTYLKKVLERKETCPTYTQLLADAITVRTIHSAKGLEFPVVVVDLIGFTPWEDTPEEIEDECRVLYVAMSRAKDQLYLLGRNKQMFPNLEVLLTFLKAQTL